MDFFKNTLDLLKRDDTKLFKNTISPASHKSSPGVNSYNGETTLPVSTNPLPISNGTNATTTPNLPTTSNNGNNGLPSVNGVPKNQPSTTTTTNSINPPSPITSPNTSEQELWKLLEKQRQRKYFSINYTNKEKVRKQRKPQPSSTVPLSNIPNMTSQNPQQIKPANPSVKRKIGGGGLIQQVNVNNGPTVKNQQPPKKIKTDIR
ncbi:predicted protein [Naegleria gruberi]|uniref:Predicted protein n=1 Tax=Naegleria gruberi TaxID=5762 RepID=D2V3Y3_NAEGR|nr:uncharacterized protein NAEGRDRAFT_46502 [Naegleria gruberi]EFC48281.1 predicted protein [Naegleria gruberi]|eukprot:XP_002681025.1 predicted protein [Naegleria gruberi strain NEG-M]